MKALYAEDGFEQDNEPQICLEGSCIEFEDLKNKIQLAVHNNKEGEISKISDSNNTEFELILINKKGDNKLVKRIDKKKYIISLDATLWNNILSLIDPLLSTKGYQFIEFDAGIPITEDVGLIFRSA